MDYKFKTTQDKINEVLEHMVDDLGIYVYDDTYKRKNNCVAFELIFNANEGLYRQEWWDNDLEDYESYTECESTEITQEQFLKMSFDDLEKGNIPEEHKIENIKIINIESKQQADILISFFENIEHNCSLAKRHFSCKSNFDKVYLCQDGCAEKEDCQSRTVVTAKDFIMKHVESGGIGNKELPERPFMVPLKDGKTKEMLASMGVPGYTQEEFQVGDEVYIKGVVVEIHRDGDIQIEYKDFEGGSDYDYFRKDQICKAKDINEQADKKTIENIEKHLDNRIEITEETIANAKQITIDLAEHYKAKELDSDFTAALNELSQKKHSSSVMMGSVDLSEDAKDMSEEIKDQEILMNRERE
jgi:hypothetical protein